MDRRIVPVVLSPSRDITFSRTAFPLNPPRRFALVVLAVLLAATSSAFTESALGQNQASAVEGPNADNPSADGQSGTATESAAGQQDGKSLEYWASQLSNERYLRRKSARQHLTEGGQASVPVLVETLDDAGLETVQSSISVLAAIAAQEPPWQTDGAMAALDRIAAGRFGAKVALARSAIEDLSRLRSADARAELSAAGIFIGTDTVALESRSKSRLIARIDNDWNGETDSLAWFRWLEEVPFVIIEGKAAQLPVFEAVVKMPSLDTIVITDCELPLECLEPLKQLEKMSAIELRYVRLSGDHLRSLAEINLRNALYLMGTGVSDERVEQLRVELPGLEITNRLGGFLGVTCRNTMENYCQVSEVVFGSGAHKAGLRSGDVIIRIDDKKITRFDDLQRQINTHIPGDEIEIRFRRAGEVFETAAVLGKLQTP
jgi:hypothetical protein